MHAEAAPADSCRPCRADRVRHAFEEREKRDISSPAEEEETMKRAIITVVGKDTIGIIAAVCTYLAENKINILDISQTIVQGYFNMMMIIDVTEPEKPFGVIADELAKIGEEKIGVQIRCQKEEIFDLMHRI
jgi:ACT domain-containing protein